MYWGDAARKDRKAISSRVSGEIDQAINFVGTELLLHTLVRLAGEIFPRLGIPREAVACGVDVEMVVIKVNFELRAVQMTQQRLQELRDRMGAQIR